MRSAAAGILIAATAAAATLAFGAGRQIPPPSPNLTPVVEVSASLPPGGTLRIPVNRSLPWSQVARVVSSCECTTISAAVDGQDGDGFLHVDLSKEPELRRGFAPVIVARDHADAELFRVVADLDLCPDEEAHR